MMGILFAGCNKEIEPDRGVAQKITGIWITTYTATFQMSKVN